MKFRDFSITSESCDFETPESRDLKGQETPHRILADVCRDSARGSLRLRQGEQALENTAHKREQAEVLRRRPVGITGGSN
jgi:hypothetical protein